MYLAFRISWAKPKNRLNKVNRQIIQNSRLIQDYFTKK